MQVIKTILSNLKDRAKRLVNDLLVEPHVSIKEIDQAYRQKLVESGYAEPNAVHIYVGHYVDDNSCPVVSRIACFPAHWKKEPYKMCEALRPRVAYKTPQLAIYTALNWIEAQMAVVNGNPIRIITNMDPDPEFYFDAMNHISEFYNKTVAVDVVKKGDKRYKIIEEANKLAKDF